MALIRLNATLFGVEKNILVVESRDSSLKSSVPSSVLSWCFWDVLTNSARLGLIGTKLAFYTVFQYWNFVLVRNMKLAPRNEFASSNFVAGSPYSLTPSSPYWTLFTKLITSHFPGFLMENKGGMHDTAFIQRIPPIDSIASCIWDTDSISWPEFKWMAMWDLIVAAFRSQHPFPPK